MKLSMKLLILTLQNQLKNLIYQPKSSNKIKIFFKFLFENVNNMIDTDLYPEQLKWANVVLIRKTTDLSVFYQIENL